MIFLDDSLATVPLRNLAEKGHSNAEIALNHLISKECKGSEWTGWFDGPSLGGRALVHEIKAWQREIKVSFDTVLVIGIGGSYLGTRAVQTALGHEYQLAGCGPKDKKNLLYIGQHMSEESSNELFEYLDKHSPIVNVISKSGTTTESSVAFRLVRDYLEKKYPSEMDQRLIVTTDAKKGALRSLVQQKGYKSFVVPDDVGGRFSVFTAVGLVPLSLAGFDIDEFVKGADFIYQSIKQSKTGDISRSLLRYASFRWAAEHAGLSIEAMSYSQPKLSLLMEWWKQLFGESEGKEGRGLFPVSLQYTTDLHSLGQYLQEGKRSILETFLEFSTDDRPGSLRVPVALGMEDGVGYLEGKSIESINAAAMKATREAHAEGGLSVLSLKLNRELGAFSLGALMAFLMVCCGVSASMLGVNPYDQPGVEAYKKKLFKLLGKPGS